MSEAVPEYCKSTNSLEQGRENPETLQQFKTNAAQHAQRFDINTIVPEYEALYNRFLA